MIDKVFLFKKEINLTSFYYTVFEGLAKGGNQLLLIVIAMFVNQNLYLKLMLLISFESLIIMCLFSYYVDVLYSYKRNRIKSLFSSFFDFSVIQVLVFYGLYKLFQGEINNYYGYNLKYVIIFIIGNSFITSILNNLSVSAQINLNHKTALRYKSVPFFMSFIFCLSFFLLFEDKVFGFFLGKFLGTFLFFIIEFIRKALYKDVLKFHKFNFFSILKRAKYSMVIALIGWAVGLGFLNFAKIYSAKSDQLIVLGLMLNLFSVIQLISNGINQVYVPQLKNILSKNFNDGLKYTSRTFKIYFALAFSLFLGWLLLLIFLPLLNQILPRLDADFLLPCIYVVFLFTINIFQWVSTPYLMILDQYREYFLIKVFSSVFAWLVLLMLFYILHFANFIVFYFIIQIISSLSIYLYIKKKYLKYV